MDAWRELCEIVEKEIQEVVDRGEIMPNEWSRLKEATIIAEKAKKIEALDGGSYGESYEDNHSGRRYSSTGNMEDNWRGMEDGSYARGRSKRTGRYVSRSGHNSKQEMIDDLRDMLDDAKDKRFKNAIRQCLETLEEG